jgi:hypothetical protein
VNEDVLQCFVEMRSVLAERIYERTKVPQFGRRECQQLPFLYRIGRLPDRPLGFNPTGPHNDHD